MPITKSAKKAMRQAKKRTATRKPFKTSMKTVIKKVLELSKNDKDAATKELNKAYKIIDLGVKKHLLHKNNAARKKSRLAKSIANSGKVVENAISKKPKKSVKKASSKKKK